MEQLTRKDREDRRKKYDIIYVAVSEFSSKGFYGTTMADISKSSEFPLATIYRLFESKEQIYFELLDKKARELIFSIENTIQNSIQGTVHKLKNGLCAYCNFCIENREFTKIYLEERQRLDRILNPDHKNHILLMIKNVFLLFEKVFQEGIDKDEFKPYSSKEMGILFVGMITSVLSNWVIYQTSDEDLKSKFDMGFEIFTQGIFR